MAPALQGINRMSSKNRTYFLNAGDQLTVTADANSAGNAHYLSDYSGTTITATTAVAASASQTFGPYDEGRYYRFESTSGELTYAAQPKLAFYSDEVPSSGTVAAGVVKESHAQLHRTLLTFTAETITISDDAGVAQYGGLKIYDFPEAMLCVMGATLSGNLTTGVTGTIIAAFNGDVALGTATATTGATLVGTEADVLASTALTQGSSNIAAVSAVSVATVLTESGARWLDGTSTAKDLYLNFVIDDHGTHTAGTATFTGTVELVWMSLGDV